MQADILMDEAELGYPRHRDRAIGHLAEAESESLRDFPELAKAIRKQRIAYAADLGPADCEELLEMTYEQ